MSEDREHAVRRGRKRRRKVCAFCVDKIEYSTTRSSVM